ncbi:hypothetical protein J7382_15695 [Shimia sp. R11_0]|nr:hypothetical protein [Shimia sp. R11_0]MBO9478991.1 hypothetical protein [Shimia sp. R11_0]
MTNPIAVFIAVLLLVALGVDMVFNSSEAALFLAKKLFDLIEWMAFWR